MYLPERGTGDEGETMKPEKKPPPAGKKKSFNMSQDKRCVVKEMKCRNREG